MDKGTIMGTGLDQLAIRIRGALERVNQSRLDWINASLTAATALHDARQHFKSNVQFGQWLREKNLSFTRDDRAALLQLACDPEGARTTLATSLTESWRTAARQLRQRKLTIVPCSSQPAKTNASPSMKWTAETDNVVRLIPTDGRSDASLPQQSTKLFPSQPSELTPPPRRLPYLAAIVSSLAGLCDAVRDAPCSPDPNFTAEAWAMTRGDRLSSHELRNLALWLEAIAEVIETAPSSITQTELSP